MTQGLRTERDGLSAPNVAGVLPTRILLATDGSEEAFATTRIAVDISRRSGSKLHAVRVVRRLPTYSIFLAHATDDFLLKETREAVERHLKEAGGHAARLHIGLGDPVEEILATGEEIGAGLIVVHDRRLGPLKRALMGDIVDGIARRAACPVLVVRGGENSWPPARVVVGEAPSGGFGEAVGMALGLGGAYGADALLVRTSSILDAAAGGEAPALVAVDGLGPGLSGRFGPGSALRAAVGPILIHAQKPDSAA